MTTPLVAITRVGNRRAKPVAAGQASRSLPDGDAIDLVAGKLQVVDALGRCRDPLPAELVNRGGPTGPRQDFQQMHRSSVGGPERSRLLRRLAGSLIVHRPTFFSLEPLSGTMRRP